VKKTKQHLEQHPELAREIEKAVRDRLIIESSPIDDFLAEHNISAEKTGKQKGIGKTASAEDEEVIDSESEHELENTENNEEFSEDKS